MAGFPEPLLERYLKVHSLAEYGGTEGERAAAGKARARMEEEHPGIGIEALRLKAARDRAANPPPPSPPPPRPPPGAGVGGAAAAVGGGVLSAEAFRRWAPVVGDAVKLAQTMSETLSGAAAGKSYADTAVMLDPPKVRDGVVRIVIRGLEADLVLAKTRLSDTQKQAFARSVGDRVAAQVYTLLASRGPGGT